MTSGSEVREGTSNEDGRVVESQVLAGLTCEIEWGVEGSTEDDPVLPNFAEVRLNATESDADVDLPKRQLANLGFQLGDDDLNLTAFRFEYEDTDDSPEAINAAHSTGKPKQRRFSNA